MPVFISTADAALLDRVNSLGLSGKGQSEIADALGVSLGALRYRLADIGYKLVPGNVLQAALSGERYEDQRATGQVIVLGVVTEPEPVGVA